MTTVSETSYTDSEVAMGNSYEYKVAAVSGDQIGENSTIVSVGVTFTQIQNIQTQKEEGTIVLQWDQVSGAQEYRVYKDGEAITTVSETSYTDTDVTVGEEYEYYVTIVSGNQEGGQSSTATVLAGGEEVGYFGSLEVTPWPEDLSQDMKQYFTQVDFDGDGVPYVFDRYLGRDDAEVDFEEKDGGNFRTMSEELSTWDPQQSTGTASGWVQSKIYNALVQYVPGTTEVMPDLAKAWEVSDDGLTYTFYLRENVEFHNGEEMTSEDVKWSFDRLKDQAYHSPRRQWHVDYIESTEATDDYTFKITLQEPYAPFLTLLTYSSFDVLPKDYCSAREEVVGEPGNQTVEVEWTDNPVGTGPWQYESYELGSKVVLVENEDYYTGEPYLDKLTREFSADPDVIVQSFNAGDIDITGIPSNHWESFLEKEDEGEVEITEYAELATFWLMINCNDTRFQNVTLRRAITMGINRQKVVQDQFKGRYEVANGPLPPTMKFFPEGVHEEDPNSFDLNKSRELLDSIGAVDTDGDGIREYDGEELSFELSSYVSPTWQAGAQVWMSDLEKVGIEMTYEQYDFATILQMGGSGNYEMMTLGWIADYPDPVNFYDNWDGEQIPSVNWARYDDEEVTQWISELRTTSDPDEREQLVQKIEEKLQLEVPHMWFFHSKAYVATYPELNNVRAGGMGFYKEKMVNPWFSD
ncbi:hypothetical protein C9439_01025 [archaeon SCG-AAA382B04]|nr:hypothetical protein C9439_01025 [archaeon SCG-AAA382B04]